MDINFGRTDASNYPRRIITPKPLSSGYSFDIHIHMSRALGQMSV